MFTIKHVKMSDGTETLTEGKIFSRERRSDGFWQYLLTNGDRDNYIATWCGDEIQKGVITSLEDAPQTIYVMNERGSTVATYCFFEPDFSRGSGWREKPHDECIAA